MLRRTGALIIAVLTITTSACAVDSAESQLKKQAESDNLGGSKVEDQSTTSGDTSTEETLIARSAGDVAINATNCTIVQFCNAPGSDGTVCKQQACTLSTAATECVTDTNFVCGARVCPWKLITTSGSTIDLGKNCHLSNSCGKQAPCGCFCDAICRDHGDCCADGPC